ncbi:MAG: lactonase family protein [Verrucomicrobia bacterium]|nr:lactonase family protein [Verrucomicrobiota bacterium]
MRPPRPAHRDFPVEKDREGPARAFHRGVTLRSSASILTRTALCVGAFSLQGATVAMASSHLIYLGTYTKTSSRGIYAVRLDATTGALSAPLLAAEARDPAWITFSPDKKFLYAIQASPAQAIGFSVDAANARLTPLPAATPALTRAERSPVAAPPSHLAVDATGRTLLAANYGDGYVASMPIHRDGTLGAPTAIKHAGRSVHPARQDKPHAHSVTVSPDNRFVIVCDLGVDKIFSYALDAAAAQLTPATPPFVTTAPGAGPRHFKFGPDGRHAFAINEMDSTITVYNYEAGRGALTPRQTVPTLPAGFTGQSTTAEVRVHPSGKFLYGSNRGHDSIAVFGIDHATGALTPIEIVPSGGNVPRNFALSPDGAWLVCGHQGSDDLTVFRVDAATGRLSRTGHTARVPMCVCVAFYD